MYILRGYKMKTTPKTPPTLKDKEFFNEDYSYPVLLSDDVKESLKRLRDELTDDEWLKEEGDISFAEFRDKKIDEIMGVWE